ncbi:hypothetical protein Hanom_Chr09g00816211 [Helianthus anomalus]
MNTKLRDTYRFIQQLMLLHRIAFVSSALVHPTASRWIFLPTRFLTTTGESANLSFHTSPFDVKESLI